MNFVKVIPAETGHVPDQDQEEAVVQLLQDLFPDAGDIDCNSYSRLNFSGPEDALESVACPRCGTKLEIGPEGDKLEWWLECLGTRYEDATSQLGAPTPCCNSLVRLAELSFEPPAGFARFEVCVNDTAGQLAEGQVQQLRDALGCDVLVVYGRYEG